MTIGLRSLRPEMPSGLRRAYLLVLLPLAALAPMPLFWTEGALPLALVAYESSLLLLWIRARGGNAIRLSDRILNAIGLSYFLWLGLEFFAFRHGLLRSVSHLLLFTTIAKLASLKRPGEARTALLVLFLLTLAAASSATHVASLLYFAAMAYFSLRALGRLAILADFEDAPPDRVLGAVPTPGISAAIVVAAGLIAGPLFYSLPRIHSPYLTPKVRIDDALTAALAADRVELDSFGAAKRNDRVVLRMDVTPERAIPRVLRLREAIFTEYRVGVWERSSYSRGLGRDRKRRDAALPQRRAGQPLAGRISVDLNPFVNGFLFLPYGSTAVELDRGSPVSLADGVVRLPNLRRSVRYTAGISAEEARAIGTAVIDPRTVPAAVRDYAARLTGDLTDPIAIARRIRDDFARNFVYTLDPPENPGDPIVNFLLSTKAGHCEFFASAGALMLTSRGIPARLVTGSYGGEVGFLSSAVVVRGANLHAWVEADLDGSGFTVFDPTPPSGIPPATSRPSFLRGVESLGRELEFFYDRRILGFDAFDQAQFLEAARQTVGSAAEKMTGLGSLWPRGGARAAALGALALGACAVVVLLWRARGERRRRVSPATRAYLRLRGLLGRRLGSLSPSIPPAEVVRLFAQAAPEAAEDAAEIVRMYCESAFAGREPGAVAEAELSRRLRRLRSLRDVPFARARTAPPKRLA